MQTKELANYLIDFLQIKVNSPYIVNDLIDDLESIHDTELLRQYIKQKFNYERYKYLNGIQKLTALLNDFKKDFQPTLKDEQLIAVGNYCDELYKRTIWLFDDINFDVQEGISIDSKKVNLKIYNAFNGRHKDIQVLKKIGDKKELLRLCNSSKEKLRDKINKVVYEFAIIKTYPQLQTKSKDVVLIERLKNES